MTHALDGPVADDRQLATLRAQHLELTDDAIARMYERIKPVVREGEELYYLREFTYLGEMMSSCDIKPTEEKLELELEECCTILVVFTLLHRGYGWRLADVFGMFPSDLPADAIAFEVVGPVSNWDMKNQSSSTAYCVGEVKVYRAV